MSFWKTCSPVLLGSPAKPTSPLSLAIRAFVVGLRYECVETIVGIPGFRPITPCAHARSLSSGSNWNVRWRKR